MARLARPLWAGRAQRRTRADWALSMRSGRARQIDADGSVLCRRAGSAQAAGAFSCLHARDPRPHRTGAAGENPRADRQGRGRHRRRGGALVLRRIPGRQHRRRDDPGTPVHRIVRGWDCGGRDLKPRARRIVRARAAPRPVSAVHRAPQAEALCARARQRPRLPARPNAGKAGLSLSARRGGAPGAGAGLCRADRRRGRGEREPPRQGTGAGGPAGGAQRRLVRFCRSLPKAARRRRLPRDRRPVRRGDRRGDPASRPRPARRGDAASTC